MKTKNIVAKTDSYKHTHHRMYPKDTQTVYSYMEAREGGIYQNLTWFGLQFILKDSLEGRVLNKAVIDQAETIARHHFRDGEYVFDRSRWDRMLEKHHGYLPVRIKAAPEGMVIPLGNVLMTVENTDPEFPWLTNSLESLLMHAWYPSTVATLSREAKKVIAHWLDNTATSLDGLDLMLQDFGFRGATSEQSAERAGVAHLLNFKGTDTYDCMIAALDYYSAAIMQSYVSVPLKFSR
jgi:nicotinamide phosphoribosyltransferase